MAELATVQVYDDVPTLFSLIPASDFGWVENNNAKSPLARVRASISNLLLKNKMTRRMYKIQVPVMETLGTVGTMEGYVAAPRVAHEITVSTAIFCDDSRATPVDVANALKLHINSLLGDAAAGTAGAYVNATNMPRTFLVSGVGGD